VLAAVLGLLPARALAQDDRVYRFLTPEQLEDMLRGQRVEFKKTDNPSLRGTFYYDFKKGSYNLRLSYFDGKDLMLDNVLARQVPLEKLNDWNKKAKFSRASQHQDKMGPFVMLEYNLDVTAGITRGTVRQFLSQFERECGNFDRFLANAGTGPGPAPAVANEPIHATATAEVVERVLQGLNVPFQKQTAGNATAYDFNLEGQALRLTNFGGKDLMIDGSFRKTTLAALNKYNFDTKFIRAVGYNKNGKEYTALESNLDCAAGVSEEMIRYFITVFPAEAKKFADYLGRQP
jgi:hypothetical protein